MPLLNGIFEGCFNGIVFVIFGDSIDKSFVFKSNIVEGSIVSGAIIGGTVCRGAVIGGTVIRGAFIESLGDGALNSGEDDMSMMYRHYVGMTRHAAMMNQ